MFKFFLQFESVVYLIRAIVIDFIYQNFLINFQIFNIIKLKFFLKISVFRICLFYRLH